MNSQTSLCSLVCNGTQALANDFYGGVENGMAVKIAVGKSEVAAPAVGTTPCLDRATTVSHISTLKAHGKEGQVRHTAYQRP